MNPTVDPDLVKAVQQHAFALKNDVGTLAFEKEELRQQCQAVVLNIITALEELGKRVSSLERRVACLEGQSGTQIFPGNASVSFYLSLLENILSLHVFRNSMLGHIYFGNRFFS